MKCAKPFRCPKCGGLFSGPIYDRDALGERLLYSCTTCFYRTQTETNDAPARLNGGPLPEPTEDP